MQSKKSCFNAALFRKNLSRSWPLWGVLSMVGALVPLYLLLELLQRRSVYVDPTEFADALYSAVTMFAPGFTAAYALLCAVLVWGYLYNARSVGMFHALPVDRTCLFVTNTLSGLAMILIPYVVVGLLICLLAAGWGFFHLTAVLNTVLAVLLLTVTFFALATLCAVLTGHAVMLPVLYILANLLAPLLEQLINNLAGAFLIGIGMEPPSLIFSPVFEIYEKFHLRYNYNGSDTGMTKGTPALAGLWVVALYALAGLAMLALAWFLYKKRHSECAGDVVAFRWMQPIFRYGIALLSALTLGRLLYELLWRDLFQQGDYADVLPMLICVILTGLAGYYAASMLLAKSKRVFRGSLKGVGIVCAGAAALMLLVSVDVLGIERRIPAPDEIASVTLQDQGVVVEAFDPAEYPEQVEILLSFHQAVVSDRDYIRGYSARREAAAGDRIFNHFIYLTYRLKNGATVRRVYDLWFSENRAAQAGTYENELIRFYEDPEVRRRSVMIPEKASISEIDIYNTYSTSGYLSTTERISDSRSIYDALLQDADEGNVPAAEVLSYAGNGESLWIGLSYRTPDSSRYGGWAYGYKNIELHPSMTNTVGVLLKLGYVTEDDVALWRQDYEEYTGDGFHTETVEIW